MAFSRAALPPLSSLGLFPDGKASFRSPVAPLAVQSPSWSASSVSDGGESIDSSVASSSSSSSSSSFGSPPGAAQQQHRSPTATPRPRLVAEPSQPMPMQQRTFGHLPLGPVPRPVEASRPQPSFSRTHTKRKSWSSHGSDPLSSSVEPPRRGSGLRAAFFQDVDSQPARVSPPEGSSERPSFSFPPRDRAWSASSDEAAEMEGLRANTSPVFDVGRQRDSDALRWATDAAQRRPSSNAPAQHRHRHSSYDIRSLLHFDEVAPPPATAASDLASFGAGDRRPSLDRRAVSDSVLDAVSQHPLLPLGPPPMRSISPNGNSGWPLSPPFFDRPHPYRRTQPTAATPSSVSRTITVSTTHNELGCDSRRAFSRTSKACDSCRSRKTRCSSLEGSRSCVRCDELGQPCVWSEPSKKRGSAARLVPPHTLPPALGIFGLTLSQLSHLLQQRPASSVALNDGLADSDLAALAVPDARPKSRAHDLRLDLGRHPRLTYDALDEPRVRLPGTVDRG